MEKLSLVDSVISAVSLSPNSEFKLFQVNSSYISTFRHLIQSSTTGGNHPTQNWNLQKCTTHNCP